MMIKKKLFLSYLIVILIPVMISGVWIYNQIIVPLQSERLSSINQAMGQVMEQINKQIDEIEETGYLISTNSVLKNFLLKHYYDEVEIINVMNSSINSLLSWFAATSQDGASFRFFTHNETIPESDFFIMLDQVENESWIDQIKEQLSPSTPYWEALHTKRNFKYGSRGNYDVYSMFYMINDNFPKDTSYLEFEIGSSHFFSDISGITLARTGYIAAIDLHHFIVSAPMEQHSFISNLLDQHELPFDTIRSASGEFKQDGQPYWYIIEPIPRLHTSIIGIVPMNEINEPWIKTRSYFFLLTIFLIIVLAAISYFFASVGIRKILRILNHVRKIQNGDFGVHIPVKGKDEIDLLAININSMSNKIDELINTVYKSQISQREAQLAALQAQIHPHFLFNTLETLRMMAEFEDQEELSGAITALGSFMRYNITLGNSTVTLATEIEHIEDYVQIQNLLLNNRVIFEWIIPEELLRFQIPHLLLQPLVENCIIHGSGGSHSPLRIAFSVNMSPQGDILTCELQDNGNGISNERLADIRARIERPDKTGNQIDLEDKHGVGLLNVAKRISYYFGPNSRLEIRSVLHQGTIITIQLPVTSTR